MADQFNTIAGWTLGAGIIALGATLVTGEYFKHHHVEKGGYHVEGAAVVADGKAEAPIAALLQTADVAKGEAVFKKCTACHTIAAGGANGLGPNLHGIMGKPIGKIAGFAYSPSVAGKGGNWDWEAMNSWMKNPKGFIEGTKMSFGGLGKGEDRANLLAYLNSQGSNLPLPAAPAADAPAAAAPAEGAAAPAAGAAAPTPAAGAAAPADAPAKT
jgi:cytochrome c